MSGLADFITARLAEDEAAARESHHEGQRWITEEEGVYRWPDDELVHSADRKADARHIARHDPARVLREVTAKRAILARYGECPSTNLGEQLQWSQEQQGLYRAMEYLATAWADHPDYRAEWQPAL